jgi:hypothetical protein
MRLEQFKLEISNEPLCPDLVLSRPNIGRDELAKTHIAVSTRIEVIGWMD